jgi:hypothetical protein
VSQSEFEAGNGKIAVRRPDPGILMSTPLLTQLDLAILDILHDFQGEEVHGRDLRSLLRRRGFRRTAPAFVFTMMSLEDKGLVSCREEIVVIDGVEVKDRYYQIVYEE